MHLTDTNYKNYYPLAELCSEGLISKVVILDMTELEMYVDEIQRHFDETVSIEALVGDYLATHKEVGDGIAAITAFIIDDYDSVGLFVSLTAEHKESVEETLRNIFQLIEVILADNQINLNDVPEWELVGMRAGKHVILAQAKVALTDAEITRIAVTGSNTTKDQTDAG